ncbi:pyridoxal phosphate-dependent aminotransferase family protein [Sorangium sp. So ce281]|uniref:aminotransferase class I/II-fold pyridoxal phosphate-dependent enzyme n=1 Tax=unclassified Sorangium TaxID=2621164 RepID=UPI003F639555
MNNVFDAIIRENLQSQRASIQEVMQRSRMFDADAAQIDGRMIRVGERWIADFASCNYLGFDLDEEIIASVEPALREWGVHPSWCRLVASPHLYARGEEELARLVGAEDFLILPTVTLVHVGVIPALMGKDGVMFLDKFGHMTMYQAAKMARDSGCKLLSFPQDDFDRLEEHLRAHRAATKKLILVDGVYSMTGKYVDLPRLAALAREYGAAVYVDDAHGFGVVGERPTAEMPYGFRGNGVVRHHGLGYESDGIMYVGGFSKAFSSLAAGVACSKTTKAFLKAYATPYDLSGPCPTASLATLLAAIHVNAARGDELRRRLYRLTRLAVDGLRALGFHVDNDNYFPIVSVWCGDNERLIEASRILFDAGVLLTLGPYPMIPKGKEELRITITSANTEEQVHEHLLQGFARVRDYLTRIGAPLRPAEAG